MSRLEYELSREEEDAFKHLMEKLSSPEGLTDDEKQELRRLNQRYSQFEDEGLRRLKMQRTPMEEAAETTTSPPGSGTMHNILHGTQFWGSLLATAVPGYVGRKLGLTTEWKHWNWVTDKLILGALPVKSSVGSAGDHLSKLSKQLEEYHQRIGLVVSCVQPEEFDGYGVTALEFVKHKDWTDALGVTNFCMVPMVDFGAGVSFELLVDATERMFDTIHNKNECVYVHCKAGKGRSWVLTMCFLMAQEGMTFEAAELLVRTRRHQVNPSESQVAKVSSAPP